VQLRIHRCACKIYEIVQVRAMLMCPSSPSNFVHGASKDTAGSFVQTRRYANACMFHAHAIKVSEPVTLESASSIAAEMSMGQTCDPPLGSLTGPLAGAKALVQLPAPHC